MFTCGSCILALQVPDVVSEAGTADLIEIVTHSTPINQFVLAVLVIFSVASWAVILIKYLSFRRAARQSQTFLSAFRKGGFSEAQSACDDSKASPLVGIFQAGYAEMSAQFRLTGAAQPGAKPVLKSLDAVDRALLRAASVEMSRLEGRLTFLATTASVTPFIGLFGTVVGIMIAFQRIGATGSTNLAVVGPGISEALVATAMGLFSAIPAVLAYNQFTHRVKDFSAAMDDFAMEFLNIVERNFT